MSSRKADPDCGMGPAALALLGGLAGLGGTLFWVWRVVLHDLLGGGRGLRWLLGLPGGEGT